MSVTSSGMAMIYPVALTACRGGVREPARLPADVLRSRAMTELTAKLASSSTVEMTQLGMPSDANGLGTAFGGRIMQWIDLAASMAGMRHCRTPVVTASIDQ